MSVLDVPGQIVADAQFAERDNVVSRPHDFFDMATAQEAA